jgi:predicted phosphodiesterase
MRYGVLADVHGNLHALEAVIDRLRRIEIDGYLIAGDLVGYGPLPNECVERAVELGATCIAGNHEQIVLGRLGNERCIELARQSLDWTREVLRDDVLRYLGSLPATLELEGGVLMAHGSLDHAWEYIRRPSQAVEQLVRMSVEHPRASVLLLGHTHRRMAVDTHGQTLERGRRRNLRLPPEKVALNPGAVGQVRGLVARASFLVLDTEARTATFHSVGYDTAGCRRALRSRGLPEHSYLLRPSRREVGRIVARRLRRYIAASSS